MSTRRFTLSVCVVALLVAGCSSGGAKQSTSSTVRATTTTTLGGPTGSGSGTGPLNVATDLGPCPRAAPSTDLTKFNRGVAGLDRELVPITASRVRMCRYGGDLKLVGERTMVRPSNAARFEVEVNRLPTSPTTTLPAGNGLVGRDCPQDLFHVVTFASDSQRVDLYESCGWVGNGVLTAQSTAQWFNELQQYTSGSMATGTVVGTVREVGGPTEMRREIPGKVVATNSTGKHWRTTTTATRPFSITLPAGTYRFTGTSPLINSGASKCFASAPVVVVGGETTEVEIVCSIR